MIFKILILIILIVVNGIFSATEIAFLSLNKFELKKEIKNNNKKATKILNLLNDSSTFLSAIQIAITLSGFLASAFAAENFASELSSVINISFINKTTLTNILVILITVILSYFTLVFGELVPKKIGMAYSKKISFTMIGPIEIIIKIFKQFINILKSSVDYIIKIFKIKKAIQKDEDEIKNNIEDTELEKLEKNLLYNVFEFNDTTIKEIMTKKKDVIAIDTNEETSSIIKKLKKYKYTRFPVTKNGEMIGLINIKDMIINYKQNQNIKDNIRKLISLESNTIIDDAFLLLRSKHEVMAQVTENNKFIGIITIEDIVEELVGEIYDEYN